MKRILALLFTAAMLLSLCACGAPNEAVFSEDPDGEIEPTAEVDTAVIGDVIEFGAYEQNNDPSDGKEAIKWLVLSKEGNKILVISLNALACMPYDTTGRDDVTWETCTLRSWLNNDFLDEAFGAEEQRKIEETDVKAEENPEFDVDPGNDTTDQIFLLSSQDAERYFGSNAERVCTATAAAAAQGSSVRVNEQDGTAVCWWWLRTPGNYAVNAAAVDFDGAIVGNGYGVGLGDNTVRPVLWINQQGA